MMRIHAKVIYRGNVNIEGLVPHIIQTFVHMGEGCFCLQTTLSLRSTKQGSTEPGLYIYVIDLSSILPCPRDLCACDTYMA